MRKYYLPSAALAFAISLSACSSTPTFDSEIIDATRQQTAVVQPVTIDGQLDGTEIDLEGHTDERGSREYNIALGEARAQTVERMLQLQGVGTQQTRVVSYGEELRVDEAHNSDAWAKNRRVNVIYEVSLPN